MIKMSKQINVPVKKCPYCGEKLLVETQRSRRPEVNDYWFLYWSCPTPNCQQKEFTTIEYDNIVSYSVIREENGKCTTLLP